MNTDPEVRARRAAKRASPQDQRRRLRNYARRLSVSLAKRLASGSVYDLVGLHACAETIADASCLDVKVRKLVLAAHDVPETGNAVALLTADILTALQSYCLDIRRWRGFEVTDPSTWPRRRP